MPQEASPQQFSLLSNVFGSAISGIIARCVTHPLDTAKARVQAHTNNTLTFRGPRDALQYTFRTEGIRGLYRGFGTVIVGGTPGTILYLCSYEAIKARLGSESPIAHFASGLLAEALACTIYVPVDVIKERMQVGLGNYTNGWHGLTSILHSEGLAGIYRGYWATLASFAPYSALYFSFYEELKRIARADFWEQQSESIPSGATLPFHLLLLASTTAGVLASWITSPLDMAKLRLQIQRGAKGGHQDYAVHYDSFWDCLHQTYKSEGVRGLFRGAGARVLYFAPATTVAMTTFEMSRSVYEDFFVS